ncbi:DUF7685 domain-containing protein [Clostridium fungisolvens]|uniref:Protein-arginine kinase activator protein n=1 Tax=Clostridium fungisolvens TaxID=1604897 RepID=A0A6V8SL61_9CLOT|nr:UvrB/UvrC motif-containing protein [Clostridium fungisolvens]GFP77917.1 Protein-arginine kinase activator protein [Clostridium fungisolvens]
MLCDKCGSREASVHIVKVVNGDKKEVNLCDKCANESMEIPLNPFEDLGEFSFQNLLSGLVDYVNKTSRDAQKTEVTCENCGMAYNEFQKTGLLGCSECYKNFQNTINPVIKRVQGDVEHVGKVPTKAGKCLVEKKKLLKLKEELQHAILGEEYERAAVLRDEIKSLQETIGE